MWPVNYVLLADIEFNGGFEPRYVSTQTWYSKASDSVGVRQYEGRIIETPTYQISVTCSVWQRAAVLNFGAMEVSNTDGGVSDWLSLRSRDAKITLRIVDSDKGFDDAVVVAIVLLDNLDNLEDSLRVNLRGLDSLLDRALQDNLYDDDIENDVVRQTPKPVGLGLVYQAEPVLVQLTPNLQFHINDAGIDSIVNAFSGGSIITPVTQWDYNPERTGFDVTVTPSARVLATFIGGGSIGLDTLGGEGAFFSDAPWAAGELKSWLVIENTNQLVQEPGIGARFIAGSSAALNINWLGGLSTDTWYAVVGKVAYNNGGRLILIMDGSPDWDQRYIEGEGPFAFRMYTYNGTFFLIGNVSIPPGEGGGWEPVDITLEYLYVYPLNPIPALSVSQALRTILVAYGAFPTHMLDESQWGGVFLQFDPTIGIYSKQAISVRDTVNKLMSAVTGWTWVGSAGSVKVGRLTAPSNSATPAITLSRLNLMSFPRMLSDEAPGLSDTFAGGQNQSPYSDSELAGITYTNRPPFMADYLFRKKGENVLDITYRSAVGRESVKTSMSLEDDVQIEATRVTGFYGEPVVFWQAEFAVDSPILAAMLDPEQILGLDDNEFFGSAYSGVNSQLIDIQGKFLNNTAAVTVYALPFSFLIDSDDITVVDVDGNVIVN